MKNKKTLFCWITLSLSAFVFADNENYNDRNFDGRDFSNKSFKNSRWSSCGINEANFSNAILDDSSFYEVKAVGAIFDGASLMETSLRGDFSNASFIGANISVHNTYSDFVAVGAVFDNAILSTTSSSGLDGDFSNASFKGADLSGSQSLKGNFSNANFENTILNDVKLNGNFSNVDFTSVKSDGLNLVFAVINGANFSGLKLNNVFGNGSSDVNFSGATIAFVRDISNSNFSNVRIINSNFFYVTNSNFSNADLSGSKISDVQGSDFSDANVQGATFYPGFSIEQIYQTKNYKLNNDEYNLSEIRVFSNSTTEEAVDWSGVNFEGKILRKVCFGAISPDESESVILTGANFKDSILSSGRFNCSTVDSSIFDGANLKNVNFYNSNFTNSSFKDADLTDITFEKSDLSGADFTNAVLSGATFSESKIDGAIIKGADLSTTTQNGFTKELLYSTKSYQTGDLSGVWFDYNNISNWDFSGQNLQNASFFASRLTNADMSKADLRGAEMTAISGAPVYKNTIMSDGIIRNFSMTSAGDSFSIRRYEPDGEGGAMISAKLDTSSTISGGAVLTIESGAEFEVVSGAVLSVGAGSGIAINASLGDAAVFNVEDGAGLAFLGGSFLEVNVLGDFNGAMRFDVIDFADVARISGVENLKKGETFILKLNGETFGGEWDFILGDGALTVVLGAVPEPATCAAVFAVLALGCAALRRRASAA